MWDMSGSRLSYANVTATLAVVLALSGGAYALSGVPDRSGAFHGCVSNTTGLLRVVKSPGACHKPRGHGRHRHPGEFAVTWNQSGPQGLPGPPGIPGSRGPQGPGATTFTAVVASGAPLATLATLGNGVMVNGSCPAGRPSLKIQTVDPVGSLQASGTVSQDGVIQPEDSNGFQSVNALGTTSADFDVLARDATASTFTRLDVHGEAGAQCSFWGMSVPSG
jgi:hypothetical protein